jgi:choline-sulfatase
MERLFWTLLTAGLLLVAVAVLNRTAAAQSDSLRTHNVLLIVADDHATEAFGAYGNEQIRTPNLDRLAAEGVRFAHAYANAPVCTPSRQSFLTGRLPHATGVTLLGTPLADSTTTMADWLGARGHRTAAIGKMHFNSDLTHGFDTRVTGADHEAYLEDHPPRPVPDSIATRPPWRPFDDPARIWLNAAGKPGPYYEEDAQATFFARRAVEFMGNNRREPFFVTLSFHEPHSPFNFPPEYAGRYDPEDMTLPPQGPEDDRWIPEVFADLTEAEKRGIVASYYTSVEYVDAKVGQVMKALNEMGLDDTLVIYLGDHGYLLGHHDRFEKHMMWEPAVNAPLVIDAPGLAESRATDAMTELIDVAPTVYDVLGVPRPGTTQGRSLMPLLAGATDRHRSYVFSEFLADNKAMVRTGRWKYIFTTGKHDLAQGYATGRGAPGLTHRLYNVQDDPHEMHNLASDPRYADELRSLKRKMLERFMKTHPMASALPQGLSLDEKLTWFCEPPEQKRP